MNLKPKDINAHRIFFFLLAGGVGFVLYLGISNTLHYILGVNEVVAAVLATLLPIPPTFWMQRRLTFESVSPSRRSLPRYAILQVGNAVLIGVLSAVGVKLHAPAVFTFFIAGVVSVVISYIVQATLVFVE